MPLKTTSSDRGKSMRDAESLVVDMLCPTAASQRLNPKLNGGGYTLPVRHKPRKAARVYSTACGETGGARAGHANCLF